MSLTTTVAPARASPIASARPRPAATPVTTATLPDRSIGFSFVAVSGATVRIPLVSLVFSDQGCPWAFCDGLLGQVLLVGGYRVGLDHRVVLVIEIKRVRAIPTHTALPSQRSRSTSTCMTTSSHSGSGRAVPVLSDNTALDRKTRTCYNETDARVPPCARRCTGNKPRTVRTSPMRIGYTAEQESCAELRSYFQKLMTPERAEALAASDGEMGRGNVYRDTVEQMGKDGWLTTVLAQGLRRPGPPADGRPDLQRRGRDRQRCRCRS